MIRGYQDDCVNAILREFDSGVKSTAAVLATALGSTFSVGSGGFLALGTAVLSSGLTALPR